MSFESEGWQAASTIGAATEERVIAYLESQGKYVADVREEPHEQRRDVDFYVDGASMDVKADSYSESNFFIEDRFIPTHWLGRFWKTRAEFWLYVFTQTSRMYVLPIPSMQRYVAERYEGLRRVQVRTYREGRDNLQIEGLLLPVRTTVQNLGIEVITLPEDSQNCEIG